MNRDMPIELFIVKGLDSNTLPRIIYPQKFDTDTGDLEIDLEDLYFQKNGRTYFVRVPCRIRLDGKCIGHLTRRKK